MSTEFDAREVLAHLNSMGYRNITAEQLKEFMKDLKRLIKYESRYSIQSPNANAAESPVDKNIIPDGFDKLYKATTEATKARLSARCKKGDKQNDNPYDPDKFDRIIVGEPYCPRSQKQSKRNHGQSTANHPSKVQKENCQTNEMTAKLTQLTRVSSAPSSVTHYIRNTPVDLYQNYQREWSRFKNLLPGENLRTNERQNVRKRMETIQKSQPKPKVYVHVNEDNTKLFKCVPQR